MLLGVGALLVGSIVALVAMGSGGGSKASVQVPPTASFCSYARLGNGTKLVSLMEHVPSTDYQGVAYAANGYVNASTPKAIRPVVVRLAEGLSATAADQPNPPRTVSAATLRAAHEFDVWVAANCK